jgi:hypothetical protein
MYKCKWILMVLFALQGGYLLAQADIMKPGEPFHGIRDYREVMPGILYRGGANNGRAPLNSSELEALCEQGIGTAIYLYDTGFTGPSTVHCQRGSMSYIDRSWEGKDRADVHRQIYEAIKSKGSPVFIHCWNGIHATGAVAATALMQFCGISAQQAVDYWKVGIAKNLQYPKVIKSIMSFKSDPALQLTPEEQKQYCPKF